MTERPLAAVITGGSSGIGLELAWCFARAGVERLLLVSCDPQGLANAAAALSQAWPELTVEVLTVDLSHSDGVTQVYAEAHRLAANQGLEGWDALVNCAGVGAFGWHDEIDLQREQAMLQLNMMATHGLTRRFLADMTQRGRGGILNVSSTTGLHPIPRFAAYAASKSFLLHYSLATNYELQQQRSPVYISTLCPPTVRSGFQQAAGMQGMRLFVDGFGTMDADQVAAIAYRGFIQRQALIIPSWRVRIALQALSLLPRPLSMRLCLAALR